MTDTDESPAVPQANRPGGRRTPTTRTALPPWLETGLLIVIALAVALVVKTFFVQAFYIPSGSMRDTLRVDDRILVEKVSYWFGSVQRGDVVVFDDPAHWLQQEAGQTPDNPLTRALAAVGLYPTGGHLVKRVIGVGGDRVACEHGRVLVNRQPLQESSYVTLPPRACTGSWTYHVPGDHLWVMGDNRAHSADSRLHVGDPGGGFIPVGGVVGKVFVVVWPPGRWQFLHRPATFATLTAAAAASGWTSTVPAGLPLAMCVPLLRQARRRNRSDLIE